ncbi:MAG TPA: hypothetical protein VLM42_21660 [Bryobacteraceae bacterium]|nr:hypothetical protein [Bryobacteraceae bacterium]
MSDQEWDVLKFVEYFRNGEFDTRLAETLQSLSPEQLEDLEKFLRMEGESRNGIVPTI